jgi:hypothetical protein
MLVTIHDAKDYTIISIGEIPSDMLSLVPRTSWNAEISISISGSVASQPNVGSLDDAIANLGIGSQAVERTAGTMTNCTIGVLKSISR